MLVAAGGPRARELAARVADTVTLAAPPLAGWDTYREMSAHVLSVAGPRADRIELSMNLFVVGDEVPPWARGFMGVDAAELIEHKALTMLRGSVPEMVAELQRRRDELGISYISVNAAFLEQFAPVVERLRGV